MKAENILTSSKKILMQYWPLQSFIATNPLWSMTDEDFYDVVKNRYFNCLMNIDYYKSQYKANKITDNDLLEAIKEVEGGSLSHDQLTEWVRDAYKIGSFNKTKILLSEQVEEYRFQRPVTWIKEKIFSVLRDYFGFISDQKVDLLRFWFEREGLATTEFEKVLSQPIAETIHWFLSRLSIPDNRVNDYLQAVYLKVYGWSSFMNWRNQHPNNPWVPGDDCCEVILLMWLFYECQIKSEYHVDLVDEDNDDLMKALYIWQTAFELNYVNNLHASLSVESEVKQNSCKAEAQFIFCIDTRSEGLRRDLEKIGNYQTYGFAGFFGAIFNLKTGEHTSYQAPALVQATDTLQIDRLETSAHRFYGRFKNIVAFTKKQLFSSFALFEIIGFWFAFFMIFKTMRPKLGISQKRDVLKIKNMLSLEDQFNAAHNLLRSIGLVDHFSKWVLICAHQTDNVNNPFKASLNCGACGGNSGVPNAIVMAKALNNPKIRARLNEVGIHIPDETLFVAACHHTTYDRIEIIDGAIPKAMQQHIKAAAHHLRQEKRRDLPGVSKLLPREYSWSELIPELGLINNAAIIVGPRELTINHDLQRRTFLHSYSPDLDSDGEILTSILSAPAIVAHWISAQYYFSTVNPELFGAGNKTIHNVLPGIGVLEGNLSDLKIGLPLQSTYFQSRALHEPRRIVVVVYARRATLDLAIERSPDFKKLLDNHWIYLKHIEAS